jgi:hypothetical protein
MDENEFREFLGKNKIENKQIDLYISRINEYQEYLKKQDLTLEKVDPKQLVDYTEHLVALKGANALDFIRAMMYYANYSKKHDFMVEIIHIVESYNAMDTLYSRTAEFHGEEIRNELFKDLTIPPLGVHPETKPAFTKIILKKLEDKLGEENTIKLLSPCLHGRPPDDIEEFAQYVDDEVIEFVKNNQMYAEGIREGNIIYLCKHPYQMKKYLQAKEDNVKRFYLCYCPWVRGALKNGTESEISKHFCHCSAGWYKLYWDKLFDQSITVEPVETALGGALECKFAVYLPEDRL